MTATRTKRTPKVRPPAAAPSFARVQDMFQEAVLSGDDAILALIPSNSRTSASVLLGVYRHAYASRLTDILRNDHPLLARHAGAELFDKIARAYVRAYPSRHPNARWFSHRLPDFLAADLNYAGRAELAELASLERALNDAFDAADAPVLGLADLSKYPAELWGELCFTPHPSVARLDLATNAFDLWRALQEGGTAPRAVALPEPQRLIVWRKGTMPTARPLEGEELMMWTEAACGVSFSALCALAATHGGSPQAAERAARHLHGWIASGLLSGARLRAGNVRKSASARRTHRQHQKHACDQE